MLPVLIFISCSLPQASLQQYLADAPKYHAQVLMQGLVGNSLKATSTLIKNQNSGLIIEPIIFEKLNIQKIPAIAQLNQRAMNCLNTQNCIPDAKNYDIVYGNVTLDYALKLFARNHAQNS